MRQSSSLVSVCPDAIYRQISSPTQIQYSQDNLSGTGTVTVSHPCRIGADNQPNVPKNLVFVAHCSCHVPSNSQQDQRMTFSTAHLLTYARWIPVTPIRSQHFRVVRIVP